MLDDASRRNHVLVVALLGTSAIAWFVLWSWGDSPYIHYLHHAHLHPSGVGDLLPQLSLFIIGWTVMTVAMMLPTSAPLVSLFDRLVRARSDRVTLVGLVVGGYVLVWSAAGVVVFAIAVSVREIVTRAGPGAMLVIAPAMLVVAGAYQFSSLKYRCLKRCRSPFSFVVEHWTGQRPHLQSLLLGISHGLFCVGCCWSLMLLMIPFGAGNLGWMLVLGTVMAIEKNAPWGQRVSKHIGIGLLILALIVAIAEINFL